MKQADMLPSFLARSMLKPASWLLNVRGIVTPRLEDIVTTILSAHTKAS